MKSFTFWPQKELNIKPSKCHWGQSRVEFHGHKLGIDGIPKARQAGFNLLNAFTGGDDNIIVNVVGTVNSSPISSLIPALLTLKIPAILPSNKIPLVDMLFLLGNKFATFDASLISNNPFDTPLSIIAIKSTIFLPADAAANATLNPLNAVLNLPLATINFKFPDAFPYVFKAGQKGALSSALPLNATENGGSYTSGFILGGAAPGVTSLPIITQSFLTVNVGGYIAEFAYQQSTDLGYGCDFISSGPSCPTCPTCPNIIAGALSPPYTVVWPPAPYPVPCIDFKPFFFCPATA
ncbi:hypothetical protein BDK51DRAFT_51187 [Blyttiomyces helicus]|uniref:Uncharacterized protein n=1 Tax=Blyttiomyces helicus TaxID=388810 RepID=A0A4V1IQR6_9FUNG|nr:hypothetical protein BDK51DRAFT_51187 [Blyttiomyces helicus]|eukprot:RKO87487.1 hypothetical protein BDK51DRAFT_51187 [Blyttiomyces helicus]